MRPAHPTSSLTDPPLSRASPLPHWIFSRPKIHVHPTLLWEQSLLAMRPAHPTSSLTDPPLSRASPLPHWIFSGPKIHAHPTLLWEQSLLAMRPAHPTSSLTDPPLSRASRSQASLVPISRDRRRHKVGAEMRELRNAQVPQTMPWVAVTSRAHRFAQHANTLCLAFNRSVSHAD